MGMAHELRFLDRADASIWLFPTPRGHVARTFDGTHYRGELPITASQLQAAVDGAAVIILGDGHELTIEPEGDLLRVIWEPARGRRVNELALRMDVERAADVISTETWLPG